MGYNVVPITVHGLETLYEGADYLDSIYVWSIIDGAREDASSWPSQYRCWNFFAWVIFACHRLTLGVGSDPSLSKCGPLVEIYVKPYGLV